MNKLNMLSHFAKQLVIVQKKCLRSNKETIYSYNNHNDLCVTKNYYKLLNLGSYI